MKLVELKVTYEAENYEKAKEEIINFLYEFGIQGVKIDEPFEKNPLDYYSNEKQFLLDTYAISVYFPKNFYFEKKKKLIIESFNEKFSKREDLIYNLEFYELDDEDYLENWKKYLYPEKISEHFVVKPTWRKYNASENEKIIELDPGRAFGTGSHPTTYLCVQLMEKYIDENVNVIDVGTGSGILMIVAKMLGSKEVWGIDIDEDAVEAAKENLELNNIKIDETIKVIHGDLLGKVEEKKFDVVVANILPDVLILLLDSISKVLKENGIIILSGIIKDKEQDILNAIKNQNLKVIDKNESKDWIAFTVKSV
ncbi:[LSU ribosomal protein L11P]-lysine N-methyltransferase [Hypnocyclicus thermotrophus]|uniref:Ribosomal protein L11 methyltransferase n=1 Tax=Hypnocyclicus thermotrophus TaxID=1627895 RepID=A0AA46DY05_9FUSO|nr:50S ribosomal protein L11 methyltransferase [Hypnocyclicus thermotrophus]TDT69163.1 [LSU ribosomal protein L11P]-lysine N-methyltransferase [Hypnocyclicus thermotrophus]